MHSTDWLTQHDLSLMIDAGGRLWRFRPAADTTGRQPIDASLDDGAIVISIAVAGLRPDDVRLRTRKDVLEIRGKANGIGWTAWDIGMPTAADLEAMEITSRDGALDIRVPLLSASTKTAPRPESLAVAV